MLVGFMGSCKSIKKLGGIKRKGIAIMSNKPVIKRSEFVGKCLDLSELLTRKAYGLKEENHLGYKHEMFRNGAFAMAQDLLKDQYQIVED